MIFPITPVIKISAYTVVIGITVDNGSRMGPKLLTTPEMSVEVSTAGVFDEENNRLSDIAFKIKLNSVSLLKLISCLLKAHKH